MRPREDCVARGGLRGLGRIAWPRRLIDEAEAGGGPVPLRLHGPWRSRGWGMLRVGVGCLEQEWVAARCGEAVAWHQPAASPWPRNLALLLARASWQAWGSAQGANALLISQALAKHWPLWLHFAKHARASELDRRLPCCELG